MSKTALLTLGRMPKGMVLAEGLKHIGWRVVVAEPMAWHLARTSRFVDACHKVTAPVTDQAAYVADMLEVVARETVSLILPISEEVLHAAELMPHLLDGVRLFAPDRPLLHAVYDKQRFAELASGLGLPVPETHPLGTPEAVSLAQRCDTVVKFAQSRSGIGLERIARGQPLPEPGARPAIVQAAIAGKEISSFSVLHKGRVIGTSLYAGTVLDGTVAVAFRRVGGLPRVDDWIAVFAEATGASGFLSFDFMLADDGTPYALECNPRMTSGVHFLDPESLARAITEPEGASQIAQGPHERMQQVLPCLTTTEGSFLKRRPEWRANLRELLRSRDVSWNLRDPLVLPLMTLSSAEIIWLAIRHRISFGEAATRDIVWNGGAPANLAPGDLIIGGAAPGT